MPIEARFSGDPPVLFFTYADASYVITQRTATPIGLVMMRNGSIALRAFCSLRQARRTFAVHRIRSIHQLNGKPHPTWSDLDRVLQAPTKRLRLAQCFTEQAPRHQPASPQWAQMIGAPTALAWWGEDGRARMDPAVSWREEDNKTSRHAELARISALYKSAEKFLRAFPKARMAMVWQGYGGWWDKNDRLHFF